jgi:hypothetical protein
LLEGESEKDLTSLVSGLRADLQPVGALEETLVEKLATLFWRYRRLIRAEAGEIEKNTKFIDWDESLQKRKTQIKSPKANRGRSQRCSIHVSD